MSIVSKFDEIYIERHGGGFRVKFVDISYFPEGKIIDEETNWKYSFTFTTLLIWLFVQNLKFWKR